MAAPIYSLDNSQNTPTEKSLTIFYFVGQCGHGDDRLWRLRSVRMARVEDGVVLRKNTPTLNCKSNQESLRSSVRIRIRCIGWAVRLPRTLRVTLRSSYLEAVALYRYDSAGARRSTRST